MQEKSEKNCWSNVLKKAKGEGFRAHMESLTFSKIRSMLGITKTIPR